MKLIVGLGNPGRIYVNSRHNIGSSTVKALAKFYKIALKKDNQTSSQSAKFKIEEQEVILVVPLTFMNLSGRVLSALLKKYKIDLDNLLVVCDDLDLEFGRLKIRSFGSSGGHRGLQAAIQAINSQKFCRLRIGIGRPLKGRGVARYVLSPFSKGEKRQIKGIIEEACDCCRTWVREGISKSMNIFNKRSKK